MKRFYRYFNWSLTSFFITCSLGSFSQNYDFLYLNQDINASDRDTNMFFGCTDSRPGLSYEDFRDKAIDASRDILISSAYQDDFDELGNNEMTDAGSVYLFKRDPIGFYFEESKVVASDRAPGDEFGFSVAVHGDFAIIGARFEDEDENGTNTMNNSGSAYIFQRIGNSWQQVQKIVASDRAIGNEFGSSVTIHGDYAAVGVKYESEDGSGGNTINNAGAVYVFERIGGTWQEVQKLVPNTRSTDDYFGSSVSLSGNSLLIGAYGKAVGQLGTDAGAAYVFERITGTWSETALLHADTTGVYGYFNQIGLTVSIDGDLAVVGGQANFGPSDVYLFKRTAGTWNLTDHLYNSNSDANVTAVSISGNLIGISDHIFPGALYGQLTIHKIDTTTGVSIVSNAINNFLNPYNDNPNIARNHFPGLLQSFSTSVAISENYVFSGSETLWDASGNNPIGGSGIIHIFKAGPSILVDSLFNTDCNNNGYVRVHSESANPPISYSWNTVPPTLDSVVIFNSGGTYTLTVVDANNDTNLLNIHMPEVHAGATNADLAIFQSTRGVYFPGATGKRLDVLGKNKTCISTNGWIDVLLDPQTTYTSATPSPDQIIGDTLRWNFNNLTFDSSGFLIYVYFDVQTTAGPNDKLCFTSTISPANADLNPSDNVDQFCFPVVSSFDPNDKQVFPDYCAEGYILNTQKLTYRIRYQNTGTDTARNIVILDTLDANLDEASFNLISQSHDGYAEIINGNVLKFSYPDIMLPDSNINEPASSGYVFFEILLKPGLVDGTIIENDVAIYFDFNEPVITDSTFNQVVSVLPVCNISTNLIVPGSEAAPIKVYPNPSNGIFFFIGLKNGTVIEIYDVTGKMVESTNSSDSNTTIDLSKEKSGIYFYKITSVNVHINGKLMKY